ncbi:MAG: aldehyde dehydrogenase family protein [Armatimonadetes bacterium]|nr:aldehyde dehydrogenase family protein [Armatimonadota bacterium]
MEAFYGYNQEQVDEVVQAAAWAIYKPGHAEELARLAVQDTGMGNYEDKVLKNRRKTLGTLRDLMGVRSVGVIRVDEATGITEIAKPVGVVAAVTPSTNPAATPANITMMALKGRNAVILSPSPKGFSVARRYVEYVHEELSKVGAPLDLVQVLPPPVNKALTMELMKQADFVTVTGSASNVRMGQTCGTPNACVGEGNVVGIVDSTADIRNAARRIATSKTFDYATSCSTDNAVVIEASVYEDVIEALRQEGGYLCNSDEKVRLLHALWDESGKRKSDTIARAPHVIAEKAGLTNPKALQARFFMVEETGVGPQYPFSGEKLAVVLAVYKVNDFDEAIALTKRILAYQG